MNAVQFLPVAHRATAVFFSSRSPPSAFAGTPPPPTKSRAAPKFDRYLSAFIARRAEKLGLQVAASGESKRRGKERRTNELKRDGGQVGCGDGGSRSFSRRLPPYLSLSLSGEGRCARAANRAAVEREVGSQCSKAESIL